MLFLTGRIRKIRCIFNQLAFRSKINITFIFSFISFLSALHSFGGLLKKRIYIYDRELLEPSKFFSQLFGISLIFHCNGVYFLLSTLNLKNCLLSFALKYLKLLLWRKVLKKSHLFKIMDYNFSFVTFHKFKTFKTDQNGKYIRFSP